MSGDMRVSSTPQTGDVTNLDGKLQPEPGAPAKVHINHKGGVETNFGEPFASMKPDGQQAPVLAAVKNVVQEYERLAAMQTEADAKGMPNVSEGIQKQMDKLLGLLDNIKMRAEKLDTGLTPGITTVQTNVDTLARLANTQLDAYVRQSEHSGFSERIGIAATTNAPVQTSTNNEIQEMKGSGVGGSNEGSGVAGSNEKGKDGELSEMGRQYVEMSDSQIMTKFSQNPEATWKDIASLPSDERSLIMQKLQMAVQQDNQLQSMLTNLLKAMHDTTKGTISNLRV